MRTGMKVAVAMAYLAFASVACAEVQTKVVDYRQGDTPLQGFLAWDDAAHGKRPGIVVVHEWWGHNEYVRNRARQLAKAGYVAFALDMFGKGKTTTHPSDAQTFMSEASKDPAALAARFQAGLDQLLQDPHVDKDKIGAIGYCFGGGVILERARAGDDLDAVVSFHGMLGAQTPAEPGKIKGRILVLTGAADPFVPADQVEAFKKEMTAAGANYKVISYPGAKHGFTNPFADQAGMTQLAYNRDADKKSWAEMLKLFKEVWR